jgi:hypothetical protein
MRPRRFVRCLLVALITANTVALPCCSGSGTSSNAAANDASEPDAATPADGGPDASDASPPDGATPADGGSHPGDASLGACAQEGTGCGPIAGGNFAGICCGQKCIPLPDNDNCGGCGEKCPSGQTCWGSAYGQASCGIVVDDCSQLHADPNASPLTMVACSMSGGGYGVCCGSGCVSNADWQSDPNNCGHCGVVCPKGMTADTGGCGNPQTPCPDGFTCNGLECDVTACSAETTNYRCNQAGGGWGVCCGSSCVPNGTCQ